MCLQTSNLVGSGAKQPIVFGGHLKNSRFWETAAEPIVLVDAAGSEQWRKQFWASLAQTRFHTAWVIFDRFSRFLPPVHIRFAPISGRYWSPPMRNRVRLILGRFSRVPSYFHVCYLVG